MGNVKMDWRQTVYFLNPGRPQMKLADSWGQECACAFYVSGAFHDEVEEVR